MSSLTLKEIITQIWGKCKSTYAKKSLYDDTAVNLGRKSGSAFGKNSAALGNNTQATAPFSYAEGSNTSAIQYACHAEGSYTVASGMYAHAEGDHTTASGYNSHAEGDNTTASGYASHAQGDHTTASHDNQSVLGSYNDNKADTLFEVGNGSSNVQGTVRSNAFEVYKTGDVTVQNNLNVGGTINSSSLKNIPVWTLDDTQESDEPVNIFKYFLGDSYNDLTTCNRWFIVMPQTSRQFFIGHEGNEGVTMRLQLTGEMHLLYFIKTSEKWTITLYNITGKLNGSGTKPSPIIAARSFVEDESGDFSALSTISTFITSTSGMMDADYTPSMDRHVITMKYLNSRIQQLLDNEITSKITEELAKMNASTDQ